MLNKRQAKKHLAYAVFTLAVYWLQAFIFSRLPLWGVRPLLLPAAVIGVGFLEGPLFGGCYGLLLGLLTGWALGTAPFFALTVPLLGMGAGLLSQYVLLKGLPAFLVCDLMGLLALGLLQSFPLLVFGGAGLPALLKVLLLQTLYSLLLSALLYWPQRLLARKWG